ncbi:MAG: NMCC_0638 family (lipo)protein [Acetobacteraceae bacterium]
MKGWAILTVVPVLVALGATPAGAVDATPDSAAGAVALFMQSCVRFATDTQGLRDWVKTAGFPEVPASRADDFLDGLPGAAYDASGGKLSMVLVSEDAGSCSVVADAVKGPELIGALEQNLRGAKINFTATDDPPDPQVKDLNNREYSASADQRSWHMLVSTVKDPAGGEAVLTTNP